jgi:predicted lipoprotein with Yx(FWY)xxD motif
VRRPSLVWPVILAVAVVLTACGSSSKKASTANTAATTTTAAANASLSTATDAKLGPILVDGEGRTLYHFTKDVNGTIACTGTCASTWPPFLVTGAAPQAPAGGGTVATVTRPDGGTQVTFNGAPLYHYSGDTKAGDTNGQGFGGLWFVVSPTASAATPTTAAPAAGTATTARPTATTARPVTNATTAPTSPPATHPATTGPPATSPPTTMHTGTTACAYPPCY